MDKERLFNNRQKRKYGPTELYHLADQLEAIIYKYVLQGRNTQKREEFLAAVYIFLGVWEGECRQLFADMRRVPNKRIQTVSPTTTSKTGNKPDYNAKAETIRIDDFFSTTYFARAAALRTCLRPHMDICFHEYDVGDTTRIDQTLTQIDTRLHHPITIIHKRAHHDDRYQFEPVDTYTSRDDIVQFFAEYELTVLSVLDPKLPSLYASSSSTTMSPTSQTSDRDS